jgi:Ca-activated chloride channel family protein
MTFLQPLGLALLALLPIIVLLHMLRVRRQQFHVPTTYFWMQALRDIREQPKLRRPPVTLLLILQLLIATLAALALSRPMVYGALAGGEFHASHTLLLLDVSASMQATDVTPSRFAAAKAQADDIITGLDPAASITLIRMGVTPSILYSGEDLGLARNALSAVEAGGGSANVREALRLATSLVKPGIRNRIIVLSDLAFSPDQADLTKLGQMPASVEFVPFGAAAANRAVTLLAARPVPGSTTRYQLLARVANFSGEVVTPTVRVLADGLPVETRQIRLNGGAQVDLRWDLPPGATRAEVRITGEDVLPVDDVAQLVLPTQASRRLVVVSEKPDVLKRVLAAIPGTEVQIVSPKSYRPDSGAAVTVFDGFLPEVYPQGALLIINPPRNNQVFPSEGDSTNTAITRLQTNSRLLDAVDLSSVTIAQAQRMKLPPWANEVIGAEAGPLLFEGTFSNKAVAVMTFNLNESNLPSRVGFPILMSNLINHLAPEGLPQAAEPGQPIVLRTGPQVGSVTILKPDGTAERFPGGSTIVFGATEAAGRYVVTEAPASGGQPRERFFTVNAGSDSESDLRNPREPRLTAAPPGQIAAGPPRGREIWPLLGLVALGVLLVEWWVAHR